jgi:hypothetical protein
MVALDWAAVHIRPDEPALLDTADGLAGEHSQEELHTRAEVDNLRGAVESQADRGVGIRGPLGRRRIRALLAAPVPAGMVERADKLAAAGMRQASVG